LGAGFGVASATAISTPASRGRATNADGGNLNRKSTGLRDSMWRRFGEVMEKEKYWDVLGKKLGLERACRQDKNVNNN
jgi:hypothetical protein